MTENFPQPECLLSTQDRLANLNESQKQYAQQLQDRIDALKGGAELKDLSVETLREIKEVQAALLKFLETKEMPKVEVRELEIDLSDFHGKENFIHFVDIAGRPYFAVNNNESEWQVIGPDGEPIGGVYDKVYSLRNINGQCYFQAEKAGREFVIGPDGKAVGGEFDEVFGLYNTCYFMANKDNKSFIIGLDEKKVIGGYDWVGTPQLVAGKLYASVEKDNQKFIVDANNRQVSKLTYRSVGSPCDVGGECYFIASQDNPSGDRQWFLTNLAGDMLSDKHEQVGYPKDIGRQCYYWVKDGNTMSMFGPQGGIGREYSGVNDPVNIGGRCYFIAEDKGEKMVVDPNGEVLSSGDGIENLKDIGGRPYFKVHRNNKWDVISRGGIIGEYDQVDELHDIGGQCYFVALKSGKRKLVRPDGSEVGGFNKMKIYNVNEQCFLEINNNRGSFIADVDGRLISAADRPPDKFDIILSVGPAQNGQLYVTGKMDNKLVTKLYPME